MSIIIGARTFDPREPADLSAAIGAATGLDLAEASLMLARSPLPRDQARALHPFVADATDAPSTPELADLIANAADPAVGDAIAALYPLPSPASVTIGKDGHAGE